MFEKKKSVSRESVLEVFFCFPEEVVPNPYFSSIMPQLCEVIWKGMSEMKTLQGPTCIFLWQPMLATVLAALCAPGGNNQDGEQATHWPSCLLRS